MLLVISSLAGMAAVLRDHDPPAVISIASPPRRIVRLGDRRHLTLHFHDIEGARPGRVAPGGPVVAAAIDFAREAAPGPLAVHCQAGLSRAPAVAAIAAAAVAGDLARRVAELAELAPWAAPNRLLLALAADQLGADRARVLAEVARGFGPQRRARWGAVGRRRPPSVWAVGAFAGEGPSPGATGDWT